MKALGLLTHHALRLHLPAFVDGDLELRDTGFGVHGYCLDLAHDQHAIRVQHTAKYTVLAIQPLCLDARDEELAAVGIGATVGHAQQARRIVLEREVLIGELATINANLSCAIALHKVATLQHKLLHNLRAKQAAHEQNWWHQGTEKLTL